MECLIRSRRRIIWKNIRYHSEFEGTTPHKRDVLRTRVYFADLEGPLNQVSAEITEYAWVKNTDNYNLSDITNKIVDSLKKEGYLEKSSN